jgi:hypothetical protein
MCVLAARAAVLNSNSQVTQDIGRLFSSENKSEVYKKVAQRQTVNIRDSIQVRVMEHSKTIVSGLPIVPVLLIVW